MLKHLPETRRALWRLRRSIVDFRLALAESKVSKLQLKLALIDLDGCKLTVDEQTK